MVVAAILFIIIAVILVYKNGLFLLVDALFKASTAQHTAVDLEIRDGDDESALGVALNCRAYNIAAVLLSAAARVDANTSSGLTLLHKAILRDDTGAASFLLEHGANIDTRSVCVYCCCASVCVWGGGGRLYFRVDVVCACLFVCACCVSYSVHLCVMAGCCHCWGRERQRRLHTRAYFFYSFTLPQTQSCQ